MSAAAGDAPFSWPARVYWEDTDAGGVVYYANYLRFLERARTEWLRARGVMQQQLATERGVQFMVLRVEADYRAAARLDDRLAITVEMRPDTRTTAVFLQRVWREPAAADGARELLVEAVVRVVCVDAKTLRPRRIGEYLA
ncbi:MAG: tol-pal system-associated acyl-CoA thioesterase [Gammaproteobacteria bacterium]|nr:tol-pal system-associated acyl-CoA thioesterase [Gammaproteobacteria bacterium]